jgi:hypothetical protein
MLLKILIVFFVVLLCSQMYLAIFNKPTMLEGLENNSTSTSASDYKPYNMNDPNNALILSQQNAGNIEVLKGRIDDLDGVKSTVDNMQQSIDSMQTQIDSLVQQQADYANQMAGSTPVDVTGTDQETTDDAEEENN